MEIITKTARKTFNYDWIWKYLSHLLITKNRIIIRKENRSFVRCCTRSSSSNFTSSGRTVVIYPLLINCSTISKGGDCEKAMTTQLYHCLCFFALCQLDIWRRDMQSVGNVSSSASRVSLHVIFCREKWGFLFSSMTHLEAVKYEHVKIKRQL